jgi:hypothetical protein
MGRRYPSIVVALSLLAACGSGNKAGSPPANAGAHVAPPVSNEAVQSAVAPPPAASTFTLAANGLEPDLRFSMPRAAAIAIASRAFGAPTGSEHNDDCGEGPMDFTKFHGLWLGFQNGRLVGWLIDQTQPALHTAGGLAVGAPRRALGNAQVDEESGVGPEFEVNGIGGVLDEHGTWIASRWPGQTCQFG